MILYWKEVNIKLPNHADIDGLDQAKVSNKKINKGVTNNQYKSKPVKYSKLLFFLNLV